MSNPRTISVQCGYCKQKVAIACDGLEAKENGEFVWSGVCVCGVKTRLNKDQLLKERKYVQRDAKAGKNARVLLSAFSSKLTPKLELETYVPIEVLREALSDVQELPLTQNFHKRIGRVIKVDLDDLSLAATIDITDPDLFAHLVAKRSDFSIDFRDLDTTFGLVLKPVEPA